MSTQRLDRVVGDGLGARSRPHDGDAESGVSGPAAPESPYAMSDARAAAYAAGHGVQRPLGRRTRRRRMSVYGHPDGRRGGWGRKSGGAVCAEPRAGVASGMLLATAPAE